MNREEFEEQFGELIRQYDSYYARDWSRSGFRTAMEMKRFAKTHRMLIPYIESCFHRMNVDSDLFEHELGIENAMELVALLEHDEKAKRFQHDYDEDEYRFKVYWVLPCVYHCLASHTAEQYGYNSQIVQGAIEDGLQVCRRVGNSEATIYYREFAVEASLAAADYDMGEHHVRLNAETAKQESTHDRIWLALDDRINLYIQQGRLTEAVDVLREAFATSDKHLQPVWARITNYQNLERLFWLMGEEKRIDSFLQAVGVVWNPEEIPSFEECPRYHIKQAEVEAIKRVREGKFQDAIEHLAKMERFLAGQGNLAYWFKLRCCHIAVRLLAGEKQDSSLLASLIDELRRRASKALEWSAIQKLDAMLDSSPENKSVRNPAAVAMPIDVGPYASPHFKPFPKPWNEIELEQAAAPDNVSASDPEKPSGSESGGEKKKTKRISEIEQDEAKLQPLRTEAAGAEKKEVPFENKNALASLEDELYEKYTKLSPGDMNSATDPLTEEELRHITNLFAPMRRFDSPERISEYWNWRNEFLRTFPESAAILSQSAFVAYQLRTRLEKMQHEPDESGLPSMEELESMAVRAFEINPKRSGIATIAGILCYENKKHRDSQRYLARACQLDRHNEYAAYYLASLHDEAGRPGDALAVVDLYLRTGGRDESLLWLGMQVAFKMKRYPQFLLYYSAHVEKIPPLPQLLVQRSIALFCVQKYGEAEQVLSEYETATGFRELSCELFHVLVDAALENPGWKDRLHSALNDSRNREHFSAFGFFFNIFEPLWALIHDLGEEEPIREELVRFLFERGEIPNEYYSMKIPWNDGEADPPVPLWRCVLKQPLTPEIRAWGGWNPLPENEEAYLAPWFVYAETETDAVRLAVAEQSRCYPIASEPFSVEQLSSDPFPGSFVVSQGYREPFAKKDESVA